MKSIYTLGVTAFASGLILAGCATSSGSGESLQTVSAPAYSLDATSDELVVAVSPARQTLQIAGSTGFLIGAGISAISDSKHRRAIEEVLQDYDAGDVFNAHLSEALEGAIPNLKEVSPMGSTAGYNTIQEAEEDRLSGLEKSGYDSIMDLKLTYGLFGFEGTLITKIGGKLEDVPAGRRQWKNTFVVSSAPILADDRLTDPTGQLGANYTSPRFMVADDAIKQWTGDGGAILRTRFEEAVEGVTAALLMDLGLGESAEGAYYLAKNDMNRKDFDAAEANFRKALALDPAMTDAKNGLAVNLAHDKRLDEAIALAEEIAAATPDYAPARYNLAWWYAVEKKDADAARPHYEAAVTAGMGTSKKIDKALKKH